MVRLLFIAFKVTLLMTLITGVAYPLFITLFAHVLFPWKASGSFLDQEGITIGSELISQKFISEGYFWPRPSAINYNPNESGQGNLPLTSRELQYLFFERFDNLNGRAFQQKKQIPSELLFASASGLDPHISPPAAFFQADRIAQVRGIDKAIVDKMIDQHIENRLFGIFGLKRVNVLKLNLALDRKQWNDHE